MKKQAGVSLNVGKAHRIVRDEKIYDVQHLGKHCLLSTFMQRINCCEPVCIYELKMNELIDAEDWKFRTLLIILSEICKSVHAHNWMVSERTAVKIASLYQTDIIYAYLLRKPEEIDS